MPIDYSLLIPIAMTAACIVVAVLYLTKSKKQQLGQKVWTILFNKDHTIEFRKGVFYKKPKKGNARIQYSKDDAIAISNKMNEQPTPYVFTDKKFFKDIKLKVYPLFNRIPIDFTSIDDSKFSIDPLLDDKDMVAGIERGSQQVLVKSETSKKDILFYGLLFLALGLMIGLVVAPYLPIPAGRQVVIQTINQTRILP